MFLPDFAENSLDYHGCNSDLVCDVPSFDMEERPSTNQQNRHIPIDFSSFLRGSIKIKKDLYSNVTNYYITSTNVEFCFKQHPFVSTSLNHDVLAEALTTSA